MGVPKFYRWLSERYPCLSQTIREHKVSLLFNVIYTFTHAFTNYNQTQKHAHNANHKFLGSRNLNYI